MVVAGNTTIDNFLKIDEAMIVDSNSIRVRSQDYWKTFTVRDGPIIPGDKFTSAENTEDAADGLVEYKRSGGCVYNSAKSLRRIQRPEEVTVRLIDESTPKKLNLDRINYWNIEPLFLGGRKVGTNLVFSYEGDKLIIKAPLDEPQPLKDSDHAGIERALEGADVLLANNVKHEELASLLQEMAMRKGIPVYYGATTAPSKDFVLDRILQYGPFTMNFEDLARLSGFSNKDILGLRKNEIVDATSQFVKAMARKGQIGEYPGVFTMGGEGMIFWLPDGKMKHSVLQGAYREMARTHLVTDIRGSLGGGDYFTGAWCDRLQENRRKGVDPRKITADGLDEVVRFANIHALNMMRYNGVTPALSSFDSRYL